MSRYRSTGRVSRRGVIVPAVDEQLQRLLDESAIRTVLARYARAIDRLDWDLLRSCYHPDATDEHGTYHGSADGFIEWVQGRLAEYDSTKHFLGNQLIEVEGDVAWTETYCLALHRIAPADGEAAHDRTVSVRYCDRFERRDGEWRIAERVTVYEPGRIDPVGDEPELTPRHTLGSRDRRDPAYRRNRPAS
jgi:ketosteroid isomerase-like protein